MNFLSLFVLLPLLTLAGLWLSKNLKQVHAVAVTGASALLILTVYLTVDFLLSEIKTEFLSATENSNFTTTAGK